MDWKDSSGSSTSSWMLSVSSVANDSSSVGTFMGCAPKGGLVVDYNLFLFLSLSPFQQLVPLEKSEKSQIFFLLTHEHKIYITEYTQHVLGEREGERKKSF